MNVYHGTIRKYAYNIWKRGIILDMSDDDADFGKGFYTSTLPAFAEMTAINKSEKELIKKEREKEKYNRPYNPIDYEPYVVEFEFDETIKPLLFENADLRWFQFVINNRNGFYYVKKINDSFHNLQFDYDVVKGPIADGDVVRVANQLLFNNDKATMSDLIGIPFPVKTDIQISFHTVKACETLKKMRKYKVGGDEDDNSEV